MLLLQCRFQRSGIPDNDLVITENIRRSVKKGTPNIRSLYRSPSIISNLVIMATNSKENVDDSTVFCRFEYHIMGARLQKIRIPVCDLRVTWQPACDAPSIHREEIYRWTGNRPEKIAPIKCLRSLVFSLVSLKSGGRIRKVPFGLSRPRH
jgi:hypothetical protein